MRNAGRRGRRKGGMRFYFEHLPDGDPEELI
jgi:hypothetical protein